MTAKHLPATPPVPAGFELDPQARASWRELTAVFSFDRAELEQLAAALAQRTLGRRLLRDAAGDAKILNAAISAERTAISALHALMAPLWKRERKTQEQRERADRGPGKGNSVTNARTAAVRLVRPAAG